MAKPGPKPGYKRIAPRPTTYNLGDPIASKMYQEQQYAFTPDPIIEQAQAWWKTGRVLADTYEAHLIEMYVREARLAGGQLVCLSRNDFITPQEAYDRMDPYSLAVLYEDGVLSKEPWEWDKKAVKSRVA